MNAVAVANVTSFPPDPVAAAREAAERARRQANEVADQLFVDLDLAAGRLFRVADLSLLPPGARAEFVKIAKAIDLHGSAARAILDRNRP